MSFLTYMPYIKSNRTIIGLLATKDSLWLCFFLHLSFCLSFNFVFHLKKGFFSVKGDGGEYPPNLPKDFRQKYFPRF